MVHGGLCLAALDDGTPLFVEHAIPGELVEATLRFRKGRTWFAAATRIVEPSPHRVAAPCPYVPECGGCDLQHVAYPHQLTIKRDVVEDALRRQGIAPPAVTRVHGMDEPWRYRWRGEFHVVPEGGGGQEGAGLGFNRARSWHPIAVDDCLIHHGRITSALATLRDLVRTAGTAELATLHLTAGEEGRELLLSPNPARGLDAAAIDAIPGLPDGGRVSTGSTTLHWRGLTIRVTAAAFMQVNWTQMDVLYQCVVDALGDCTGLRIVDAYAGIGVLAVYLASTAREVVCIEGNRDSARTGVLNARVNDVASRVRYVAEAVEVSLGRVMAAEPVDRLILDPPRAGCGGRVTGLLALTGPERIVYMSCDPATLARDLHVLVASGPYAVDALDIIDMFPQTHHVECAVSLSRR